MLLMADVAAATGSFGSLRGLPTQRVDVHRYGDVPVMTREEFESLRARAGLNRVQFSGPGPHGIAPYNGTGATRGSYRMMCYETLLPEQWRELDSVAHRKHPTPRWRRHLVGALPPREFPTLYDVASVAYVARPILKYGGDPRLPANREKLRLRVRANPDALPRAYLLDRYQVLSRRGALERVVAGDFDPQREVLLDGEPQLTSSGQMDSWLPADIVEYRPERVTIDVRTPHEALLVLTDTDAPGWVARVDGEQMPIHRANGLFRAVRVPAGEHRVEFAYVAPGLREGALVSVLSLLVVGLVAWFARQRDRPEIA